MADDTERTTVANVMDDTQKGIAWFIVIAFVLLIFVWVFRPPVMAPESMAQLNQLVSTLQNILLLAVGFFFGSSKGAQNKDEAELKAKVASSEGGSPAAIVAAAEAAAPAAAAEAAPPAAAEAAPPAVEAELTERGFIKPKE